MRGIDIASYQGNVDFQRVKNAGIEVVYIKATEGLTYKNPFLESQYSGAISADLKIGFYHYLRANDPISEAQFFLSVVDELSADCKYVIDVEELFGQTVAKVSSNVRIFADYLISNNYEPCIYTNDNFYATNLDSSVKNLPLWVANYGASVPNATTYVGFQFSNTGRVDGVTGPVDLDDFSSGIFIDSVNPQPIVNIVVRTFQRAANLVGLRDGNGNRLVEDGIVGIRTSQVIAKVFVTTNATGALVRWIQHRLIAQGFNCGPTGADSIFGPLTLGAVQRFQTSRGLASDGIVGPLTTMQLLR